MERRTVFLKQAYAFLMVGDRDLVAHVLDRSQARCEAKKAPVEESYQEAIAKKTQGLKKVEFSCQRAMNDFLEDKS